jgi:hypothetical protein
MNHAKRNPGIPKRLNLQKNAKDEAQFVADMARPLA